MTAYEDINAAINEVFFLSGRSGNQPVYLDIEDEVRGVLSDRLSVEPGNIDAVIGKAVAQTIVNGHRDGGGPYSWHIRKLRDWLEAGRRDAPPFTAFLCALSIAAERMRSDSNFSANNYYQRLFEILGVDDEETRKKLRSSARYTRWFWRALNQWLEDHDHRFGRPTARTVNNTWKYVGYAVSQALIRDADRKKLHDMFVQFGFSPHEKFSEPEMQLHLADWMSGHGPSPWLKRLWSNPDLRERISNTALVELETWDGTELGDDKPRSRLRWSAALCLFPVPRLELYLSAMEELNDEVCELIQHGEPTLSAKQAFGECENGIYLSSAAGADFAILLPTNDIALVPLMAASFELREPRSGRLYAHQPKPIIPMLKLPGGPYYREVSRASLFSRHMILCHGKTLVRDARALLEACARDGFREYSDNQLAGMPAGWTLFENVELLAIPERVPQQLETLVPLDAGVSMLVTDGLPLGPSRWHADVPPVIVAASENDALALELREESFNANDPTLRRVEADNRHCVLQLRDAAVHPGQELYVVALEGKLERSEKRISLQRADLPRPLDGNDLAFDIGASNAAKGISAVPVDRVSDLKVFVRGMLAPLAKPGSAPPSPDPRPLSLLAAAEFDDEQSGNDYREEALSEIGSSCVLDRHYWICEAFKKGDKPSAPRRMHCKNCGAYVLTRDRTKNRGRAKKKRPKNVAHARGEDWSLRDTAVIRAVHAWKRTMISPDTLLDALCYLNAGSWGTFQSVVASASDEPGFATEIARALHDLGHLDLRLNQPLSRVEAWSIAPPVLVLDGAGSAFLSGFRCEGLLNAVREALEVNGCDFEVVKQERAPAALWFSNVNGSDARDALDSIRDPHGRALEIVDSPALGIALGVPRISRLLEELPVIHFDAPPDLHRFDFVSGRWTRCQDTREHGAYRTTFAGRRYLLKSADGACREGSFEIVKTLAAAAQLRRLHAYDAGSMEFHAALGCGPPGLLRRALVACSGALPRRDGRRLVYARVDAATGATVLDRLYG